MMPAIRLNDASTNRIMQKEKSGRREQTATIWLSLMRYRCKLRNNSFHIYWIVINFSLILQAIKRLLMLSI
jgi:hypothetical protein